MAKDNKYPHQVVEINPEEISLLSHTSTGIIQGMNLQKSGHRLMFLLVSSGEAVVESEDRQYKVSSGMVYTHVPFRSFRYIEISDDYQACMLTFMLDFLSDFPIPFNSYFGSMQEQKPALTLTDESFRLLTAYMEDVQFQLSRTDNPMRLQMVRAGVFRYATEVCSLYIRDAATIVRNDRRDQIVDEFMKLLYVFFRNERRQEFYARRLCLSSHYLSKIVKRQTGKSVSEWIIEFTLREAKRLLQRNPALSISQITDRLHFQDSSYFAYFFRKYTGMSPTEYRQR